MPKKLKKESGPPKNEADFSSNWKKLQATLPPPQAVKRKQEAPDRQAKRRRVDEKGCNFRRHGAKPTDRGHKTQNGDRTDAPAAGVETKRPTEKNEIWFDDVDELLLERPEVKRPEFSGSQASSQDPLMMRDAVTHATKALAMDCEMVGPGREGKESVLARVSLVNQHGHCVYDKFVRPREKVTDYRTHVSGVRPRNLWDAEEFLVVQKKVSDLLKGKVLVGHALKNDLKVLFLDHPRSLIRDTSRYKPFRRLFQGRTPSLKKLTAKVLGVDVQQGEHNSVQDAQAAMRLYMTYRKRWEKELSTHRRGKGKNAAVKKKKKKAESTKKVTFADNT